MGCKKRNQPDGGIEVVAELESMEPYAVHLEHGTPKMAPRPFVEKIKEEAAPEIRKIYSEPYTRRQDMALVIEKPTAAFDMSQIRRGYLLWGRHHTWEEGKAGFVTSAAEDHLIVQYYPGIGNVTNHFIIPVSEAAGGQWEIRWSADMAGIQGYNIKTENRQQEKEGDEGGDTGGIDL